MLGTWWSHVPPFAVLGLKNSKIKKNSTHLWGDQKVEIHVFFKKNRLEEAIKKLFTKFGNNYVDGKGLNSCTNFSSVRVCSIHKLLKNYVRLRIAQCQSIIIRHMGFSLRIWTTFRCSGWSLQACDVKQNYESNTRLAKEGTNHYFDVLACRDK